MRSSVYENRPRGGRKTNPLYRCLQASRTTKLYDRAGDEITLDEVERIAI
jgi:hypothetical protein